MLIHPISPLPRTGPSLFTNVVSKLGIHSLALEPHIAANKMLLLICHQCHLRRLYTGSKSMKKPSAERLNKILGACFWCNVRVRPLNQAIFEFDQIQTNPQSCWLLTNHTLAVFYQRQGNYKTGRRGCQKMNCLLDQLLMNHNLYSTNIP